MTSASDSGTYYPQLTGLTADEYAELCAAYDKDPAGLTGRERELLALLDAATAEWRAGR